MRLIEAERPSVVFLGPAFNAGRFGLARATFGSAVAQSGPGRSQIAWSPTLLCDLDETHP